MNIWIYNHYADPPSRQATRTFDIAADLVKRGHQVTIFAAGRSHYTFDDPIVYKRFQFAKTELIEGVRFLWIKTPPYEANDWRRALNMLVYCFFVFWASWGPRPDVIIGVTVHPFAAALAWGIAKIRRSRFFFEITDLWPETLIEFGQLSADGTSAKVLYALETFLLKRAEYVIVLHANLGRYTSKRGIANEKLVWIPHGVNLNNYKNLEPYTGELKGQFRLMYLGGLVWSNDLDTILEAFNLLKQSPQITLEIYGQGSDQNRLEEKASSLRLTNVSFHTVVPKRELHKIMSQADCFIMALRRFELYHYGVSLNKLTDYLASQRPIIIAVESDHNPVEIAKAGLVVPPQDPQAMADAIHQMYLLSAQERFEMGQRGLAYLKENHSIPILAQRLESILTRP
ncbi:MAG: glycosyltransferase family 4 protein [Cytophagales bacterium]|nr:glycosyltransferase family 4 protein [Cytophagales bacterium]